MPLYEYGCASCGERFERRQRFDEPPVQECPDCGGSVYRLIQPAGIIFKGSGFYCTDNRSTSSTTTSGSSSAKVDTTASATKDEKKASAATAS